MGRIHEVSAGQGGRQPVLDSYARLSRNRSGKLEKVETQHADNGEVIERLGGVLGEEIDDPKLSAWNPKVHRPGWDTLLKRLASGASDGFVVWNTDRGWRQCGDLEDAFRLIEDRDNVILGSSHGSYDLSDYQDRYQLRQEVAHNQRSSDEASHRIKRRFKTLRGKGIPHQQGRCFGFPGLDRTVPAATPKTMRKPVSAVLVERERAALREGTAAVLAGIPLGQISDDWNGRDLATTTGKKWTPQLVKTTLLRPRNAGLVEHDGDIVGRMEGEPIVDPREFERLRALFAGRKSGRQPGEQYLASGIAVCGACKTKTLSGKPHNGYYRDGEKRRQYTCAKHARGCGKVSADARAVDRELRALVISVLSDKKHAAAIKTARAHISDRLADIQAEIAECEQRQEAISEKFGLRKMTEKAFDKANEPLMADLERLYAERDALTGGAPEGPTEAMSRDEVEAKWEAANIAEKRAMLRDALGRDTLMIDPAVRNGKRTFDPERVKVDPYKRRRAQRAV